MTAADVDDGPVGLDEPQQIGAAHAQQLLDEGGHSPVPQLAELPLPDFPR